MNHQSYLEKAACLLDEAAQSQRRGYSHKAKDLRETAKGYALLAAIDKGVLRRDLAADMYRDFGGDA